MDERNTKRSWPRWLTLYLLFLGALLAAGLAMYSFCPDEEGQGGRFTILQINDLYRIEGIERGTVGGLARVRTLRTRLEQQGRPVLVLHGGDLLFPSVMSKYLDGVPMIRALNLLDGDAAAFDKNLIATFGNHEFDDRRPEILLRRIEESGFSWVSSNVRYAYKGSMEPLSVAHANVYDVMVRDVGGVRVGIFGVTCDAQKRPYVTFNYDNTETRDAVIRAALAKLADQRVQVVIALTHQDLKEDIRIARAFPEIHLIVGGHEHAFLERRIGRTWITKADADARSVVRIDVTVAEDGTVSALPERIPVVAGIREDGPMKEEAEKSLKQLETKIGRPLNLAMGSTVGTLEGVETAIRQRETALGNFLADVIRTEMKSEIALVNGGAIRINDNIPANSEIKLYDMEGIFYYDDDLVTFELTGSQLLDLLRKSVSEVDNGHGRFLQVSGIRFTYHPEGTAESPVYRIDSGYVAVRKAGAEGSPETYEGLDTSRTYRVATLSYLFNHGGEEGYEIFTDGKRPKRTNPGQMIKWRSLTEARLKNGPVTTQIDGRIRRAS